jgi:hypothetical protein
VYGVKGRRKRAVVEGLAGVEVAGGVAEVVRPRHGRERVDGLGVYDGWSCNGGGGGYVVVSANCDVIRRHCGRVYWLNIKAAGVVSCVTLQAFFGGNPR